MSSQRRTKRCEPCLLFALFPRRGREGALHGQAPRMFQVSEEDMRFSVSFVCSFLSVSPLFLKIRINNAFFLVVQTVRPQPHPEWISSEEGGQSVLSAFIPESCFDRGRYSMSMFNSTQTCCYQACAGAPVTEMNCYPLVLSYHA